MNNGGIIGPINTPTTSVASGVWGVNEVYDARINDIWPTDIITIENNFNSSAETATWDNYYGTVQQKTVGSDTGFTGLTAVTVSWGQSAKSYDVIAPINGNWEMEFRFYTYSNTAQSFQILDADGQGMVFIANYDWSSGGNVYTQITDSSDSTTVLYNPGTYLTRTAMHTIKVSKVGNYLNSWVDGSQTVTNYDVSSFSWSYTYTSKLMTSVHKNSTGVTTDAMIDWVKFIY